jgi:hypothetical protein
LDWTAIAGILASAVVGLTALIVQAQQTRHARNHERAMAAESRTQERRGDTYVAVVELLTILDRAATTPQEKIELPSQEIQNRTIARVTVYGSREVNELVTMLFGQVRAATVGVQAGVWASIPEAFRELGIRTSSKRLQEHIVSELQGQ